MPPNSINNDHSSNNNNEFVVDPAHVQALRARKAGLAAFNELVNLKGRSKLLSSKVAKSSSQKVKLIDWSDIKIIDFLGKGSFSEVFSATLRSEEDDNDENNSHNNEEEKEGPVEGSSSSSGVDSLTSNSSGDSEVDTTKDAKLLSDEAKRSQYAIKCIRRDIINDDNDESQHKEGTFEQAAIDLVAEGHILSKVQHDNIIGLYGIKSGDIRKAFITGQSSSPSPSPSPSPPSNSSPDKKKKLLQTPDCGYFLMLEVLDGTLTDRLDKLKRKKRNMEMQPLELWDASMNLIENVAIGVAKGLRHMHGLNVVLRDLKPDNIGFNRQGVTKLCDFGFAREVHTIDPEEVAGSMRYMAPEVALYGETTCMCDVYSFGVLLYEICRLTKPYERFNSRSKFVKQVIEGGYRPSISSVPSPQIQELIEDCWQSSPSHRPDMTEIIQRLETEVSLHKQRKAQPSMNRNRSFTLGRINSRQKMSSQSLTNVEGPPSRSGSADLSGAFQADTTSEQRNTAWSDMTNTSDGKPKTSILMSKELKSMLGSAATKPTSKIPRSTSDSSSSDKPKLSPSKPVIKNNELRASLGRSLGLSKCPPTTRATRQQMRRQQNSSNGNLKNSSSKGRISSFLKSSTSTPALNDADAYNMKRNNASFLSMGSQSSLGASKIIMNNNNNSSFSTLNGNASFNSDATNSNASSKSRSSSFSSMSRLNFGFLRRKPLFRKSRSRLNLVHKADGEEPSALEPFTANTDMLTADLQKLSAAVAAVDN
eukprot:CAMPEP_0113500116 /NCGR_PEP_ID=MMETSP0014_2-20120614/32130_1 /TAXON_ID=2857 /ORGANISM="Nitzschia sp." /LENGTH=761 /DNA_ID=CAMNT_0000394377 /DNA_START=168 /DNA_END=2453 /DNA_ORIENTATION=+ /assembly_acc=CAM_ASM_000159